jgi:hypothetical protein
VSEPSSNQTAAHRCVLAVEFYSDHTAARVVRGEVGHGQPDVRAEIQDDRRLAQLGLLRRAMKPVKERREHRGGVRRAAA